MHLVFSTNCAQDLCDSTSSELPRAAWLGAQRSVLGIETHCAIQYGGARWRLPPIRKKKKYRKWFTNDSFNQRIMHLSVFKHVHTVTAEVFWFTSSSVFSLSHEVGIRDAMGLYFQPELQTRPRNSSPDVVRVS